MFVEKSFTYLYSMKQLLLIVVVSMLCFLFVGCEKEDENASRPDTSYQKQEIVKIMDHLVEYYDFKRKDLNVRGEYIIAEGDMLFPIETFREDYGKAGTGNVE